jgi:hypothetical protein
MAEDLILSDDPDAPCLDLRAAAARLGVRPGTFRIWLLNGQGPPSYRLPNSTRLRFSRREIDEWCKGYKRTPSGVEMVRRSRLQSIAAAAASARKHTQQHADAEAAEKLRAAARSHEKPRDKRQTTKIDEDATA